MRPLEAVAYLHDRGAHFVLCHGKRAIWWRWQRRRPSLGLVLKHGREIGLIPYSVGASALDIDYGDIGELIEAKPPLVTVASPRGAHAYYQDNTPRGNKNWQAFGCRGEVRSARGYLRLYEGGAERLASALRLTPSGTAPFPDDLFEAMGVEAPRMLPVEAPRVFRVKAPDDLPDLATMLPGGRNNALFDCVRFWSYAQDKAPNLDAWADRVERIASQSNERFPVPLAAGEVNRPAWSVASWTWAGGGPMDHTPATQRRRGLKSGRVRRAATRERDRAIVEAVEAGQSMRSVAKAYGLGALLVNNEAIHLVATFLEPEHFFLPVHGRIYAAVMHYVGRREIANPVTLRSCFENDEALQEAGGAQSILPGSPARR